MIEAGTRMLRGIGHDLRTALAPLKLRAERMGESGQKDAYSPISIGLRVCSSRT
ncbi:hypothetical protein [Rhizobium leguminosarum]|uniref:hypothetical protein n=1 Tax=Rhizobium leguminosarum TaxID=384 RepID=UPI00197F2595|nr:hypothetical protein [Rhizobium leguminosarum]